MNENKNESLEENSIQKKLNNLDKESINNLASNLLKNENAIDLNSIMQLTTTLLKNDKLLNSVANLNKTKQNSTSSESNVSDKQENPTIDPLPEKVENIVNDLAEIKQKNTDLASISEKLQSISDDLSEIKQVNGELASLSNLLKNITTDLSEIKKEQAILSKYVSKKMKKK